ncbi:MAG TPA: aminotransferase class I/II-fold pyridoxal phosphate-dependent enzyme [Planctomycetota bacterium]
MKTSPSSAPASARAASGQATCSRVGSMAAELVGSEILQIASEIRARKAAGAEICNLTVGDFDPRQFPIPAELRRGVVRALEEGETNYPPSEGVPELREAVCRLYARELDLALEPRNVLVAGGARPLLYVAYRTLLDPGETVVYPTPSWNNNHYVHLAGARGVAVPCGARTRFLPTARELAPHLSTARLVTLCSPLNPTGTAYDAEVLRAIGQELVAENERRRAQGGRELFFLYDQVYWKLCVAGARHVVPSALVPALASVTVYVDAISKAFAATGLRVGWAVGPADVIERMSAVLGHVGGWAPRAEQLATARFLDDVAAGERFLTSFRAEVDARLARLHEGFEAMRARGLPVESLPPMGAIYLSVRIAAAGRRTPSGATLQGGEDVRRYLLDAARVGLVPFRAFGVEADEGWFRLSVGAVSLADVEAVLPRIERALTALS